MVGAKFQCPKCGKFTNEGFHFCVPKRGGVSPTLPAPDRPIPKPDYPRNGVQPTIPANPCPPRPLAMPLTEERIREIVREEIDEIERERELREWEFRSERDLYGDFDY